jgi:hypothetical protein
MRLFILLSVFWAGVCSVSGATRLSVPQLPESPYDDTEISTNIAFSAGDASVRAFSFSLELNAMPSNTVQLAFGKDEDSDGVLSWQETDFLVGWRCGGWFFRDKVLGGKGFVVRGTGHRALDWSLKLGPDRSVRTLSAKDGASDLGFAASRGMFNPAWNILRVTMRGIPEPVYVIHGGLFAPGFSIRIQ